MGRLVKNGRGSPGDATGRKFDEKTHRKKANNK